MKRGQRFKEIPRKTIICDLCRSADFETYHSEPNENGEILVILVCKDCQEEYFFQSRRS